MRNARRPIQHETPKREVRERYTPSSSTDVCRQRRTESYRDSQRKKPRATGWSAQTGDNFAYFIRMRGQPTEVVGIVLARDRLAREKNSSQDMDSPSKRRYRRNRLII